MRSGFAKVALVCVLGIVALTPVFGATLTKNGSFSSDPGTGTVWIDQFNPAYGTLTAVDIVMSVQVNTQWIVQNLQATPISGTINSQIASVDMWSPIAPDDVSAFVANPETGPFTIPGSGAIASAVYGGADSQAYTYTLPLDLAVFEGLGQVGFNWDVAATIVSTWNGDALAGTNTDGFGQVRVVYEYTPADIPEFGTLASFGALGLPLIGFAIRRRRS